jgi:cytochrome c-type biogenesis protein CcmH
LIRVLLLAASFVCFLAPFASQSQETSFRVVTFANAVQEKRYKSLINELRCLVCQNQTIADSDADLAQQLRREVHSMILDGRADSEIVSFMVERYGDFVLFNPPLKLVTSLLWFGPFLFLAIGLGYLFVQIRKRSGPDAVIATDRATDN